MSKTLSYLHDVKHKTIMDGKKVTHEELVINGPKGLSIKYYHKDENVSLKIVVHEKDGKFMMRTMEGEEKKEKELTKEELVKELSKNKELKFALEYVKSQKGGVKVSKKTSRKSTAKKVSKKSSRKTQAKKTSKKQTKK